MEFFITSLFWGIDPRLRPAERGNVLSSRFSRMTLDTQMTLALFQELLMALRANDADGYQSWLALGIEKLGREVAGEVESEWMVPLLVEEERDRLIGWQLGVDL